MVTAKNKSTEETAAPAAKGKVSSTRKATRSAATASTAVKTRKSTKANAKETTKTTRRSKTAAAAKDKTVVKTKRKSAAKPVLIQPVEGQIKTTFSRLAPWPFPKREDMIQS